MYILYGLLFEIIVVTNLITIGESLRCRTENSPSDGELKRVARSCMRKFGDIAFTQHSQQQQQQLFEYNQEHQQAQGSRPKQRVNNRDNRGYYEDNEENDDYNIDDGQQLYNNNGNYNRQHYANSNNNNKNNNNNRNNNNSGGHNEDRQPNRNRYSNNNNNNNQSRTQTEHNNNQWNYLNQETGNRRHYSNNNHKIYNQNNSSVDMKCIVHCFFNEMHMLNNEDYPDRHKMLYILTKDIRDRELRNFYTDTIQECFRYLENQRKRDKCKFSRDLIACMTEYAKGNCDDWNEFNMMFN